ncbi:MAG: hypothetical protein IIT37_11700 [Bacteroidales bacterium]|nr:hypothetical protein [Bacteroidales bacterium]
MIELLVLKLLGEKEKKILVSSLIVNALTNPAINYFIADNYTIFNVAVGEVIVVMIEMIWYYFFGKTIKDALIYSALCNAVSFFAGNVIYFCVSLLF